MLFLTFEVSMPISVVYVGGLDWWWPVLCASRDARCTFTPKLTSVPAISTTEIHSSGFVTCYFRMILSTNCFSLIMIIVENQEHTEKLINEDRNYL